MEIIPIKISLPMPLCDIDERLIHIEEVIDAKRRMLIQKQKKIRYVLRQNKFLDTVKNDYINYYRFIIEQKQDQIKALALLNNYINDLSSSEALSKNNMEDAKIEQKRILHEIKLIKRGLNNIIINTNNLNSDYSKKNNSM